MINSKDNQKTLSAIRNSVNSRMSELKDMSIEFANMYPKHEDMPLIHKLKVIGGVSASAGSKKDVEQVMDMLHELFKMGYQD